MSLKILGLALFIVYISSYRRFTGATTLSITTLSKKTFRLTIN